MPVTSALGAEHEWGCPRSSKDPPGGYETGAPASRTERRLEIYSPNYGDGTLVS